MQNCCKKWENAKVTPKQLKKIAQNVSIAFGKMRLIGNLGTISFSRVVGAEGRGEEQRLGERNNPG